MLDEPLAGLEGGGGAVSTAASTLVVRVARKAMEAHDICSLELVAADGGTLPAFSAGSHVDVHLPGGLVRQYSLCNDPSETHRYTIAVLRDPASRGGSSAMHDAVNEGDTLTISAPKNHFTLAHDAKTSLLLAGGIGITPILCMAERLAALGAEFTLHYGARARDRMAFIDRVQRSHFADKVALHFDDGAADQRLDIDAVLAGAKAGTHLYVCGPKGFMDAVLNAAHTQGWPEARLHWEFFAADAAPRGGDRPFEVQIASSGRVIAVPADQTIVQALLQ
ncbi:MAG TPA: ferredoxin reductase, partial [Burkholderiaceae bacterium]|nr:ferredoxin reductase [Burkholderiaceae bacterium]